MPEEEHNTQQHDPQVNPTEEQTGQMANESSAENSTENIPADGSENSSGKKILLIEDETFISELYVRALKNADYDPKVVIDGEEALKEAKTDAYDIILLDIMLPNKTGTDILRELREQKPPIKARIIITTNLELGEEGRMKIESQADGYIVKADVTPKELVTFLEQLQLN